MSEPVHTTGIGEYLWAMDVAESGPYRGHPVYAHLIVRVEQGRFGEIRHGACGRTFTAGTHPRGWWSTKPGNLPLQEHAVHCGSDIAKAVTRGGAG